MKNFLLDIFSEIQLVTLYYSTGALARFLATLKICKKCNFNLHNIKTCICIREKYINGEFSPCHFWQNLAKNPVL